MRNLLVVTMAILLGLITTEAQADIRVTLPQPTFGNDLATFFDEAADTVEGVDVSIQYAYRYVPNSIQAKTEIEEIVVDIKRTNQFLFWDTNARPHLSIVLKSGVQYLEVVVQNAVNVRASSSPFANNVRTSDRSFQKIQPAFDNLLGAVYRRIGSASEQ